MDKSEGLKNYEIFLLSSRKPLKQHNNDRHSKMPQVWQ